MCLFGWSATSLPSWLTCGDSYYTISACRRKVEWSACLIKGFVMRLAELAFACHIYAPMTDYDSSYRHFRQKTTPQLDLKNNQHRMALIEWLNAWGCRQFARAYHDPASEEIHSWYQPFDACLFSPDKSLLKLTNSDLALVEQAYAELVVRTASMRKRHGGGQTKVTIGPTGTAKILFALRPNALVPWDEPIRRHFQLSNSAHAYIKYLQIVRENLEKLDQACKELGYRLSGLPELLNRPTPSLTKLIDEYFWVTISRKCPAPASDELSRWAKWW